MDDKKIISELNKGVKKGSVFSTLISFLLYTVVVMGVILSFVSMIGGSKIGFLLLLISAGIILIMIIRSAITAKKAKKRKEIMGEYVIKPLLEERLEVLEYSPNKKFDKNTISQCKILPGFSKLQATDYFRTMYKGVEMEYCDLVLTAEREKTYNDGSSNSYTETVFRGSFIRLHLEKNLYGYVTIMERKNHKKGKSLVDSLFGVMGKNNLIETKDETFDNYFEVRSDDEHMALELLTPQFRDRIVKIDEMAQGYTNIYFSADEVTLALNNNSDNFEINKKITNVNDLEERRNGMRTQLSTVLSIVDEVLANEMLFD